MVQRCEDFCLALEASEMVRIARDRRRQHFESHLTFQVGIGRAIHLAHPACSEWGDDFVRTEANAWGEHQAGTCGILTNGPLGPDFVWRCHRGQFEPTASGA
jgi:hypothetical protein